MGGAGNLGPRQSERSRVTHHDVLKFFNSTQKVVFAAGCFPLALKLLLVRALFAFVVLQLDSDLRAWYEQQPIGDAGPHAHALEVHLSAKAAYAFVGDVEDAQLAPQAGFIQKLFAMHLEARLRMLLGSFLLCHFGLAEALNGLSGLRYHAP